MEDVIVVNDFTDLPKTDVREYTGSLTGAIERFVAKHGPVEITVYRVEGYDNRYFIQRTIDEI